MTLQNQVYIVPALGKQGYESRQDPITQGSPYFAMDDGNGNHVIAGGFIFQGSKDNEVVATATAGTEPLGVAVFQQYQIGINPNVEINQGEIIKGDYRGCIFSKPFINSASANQHVLIDPTTGTIMASNSTSASATAGTLSFNTVDDVADFKLITAGTLTLTIDGSDVALTSLDFSSATSLSDVASVLNTALSSDGTCAVKGTTGLTFTSSTTGSSSTVVYKETAGDIGALLNVSTAGNMVSVDGANAFNDTKWTVKTGNSAGQVVEIQRI